jgi:redox-sensitive bicupin YhaK (pirin superfamily)
MSAGSGITHSEMNASAVEAVHFVQMWVPPDTQGLPPGYEQRSVEDELAAGGLVTVASADDDGAVHINQKDARLLAARLDATSSIEVPDAPHVHVFVARGSVELEGSGPLSEGDAARLTAAGARRLIGGEAGAEVLIWATA